MTASSGHMLEPARPPVSVEHRARTAVNNTLQQVREILHRRGRLSSRHEALDEVAKLFFAHVGSIDTGGYGIGRHILKDGTSPAIALREFVAASLGASLPRSHTTATDPPDIEIGIRPSEEELALELIDCFEAMAPRRELLEVRGAGHLDILNQVFGQFLADSFIDERELGQYLTPTEVVRTMVALGVASVGTQDLDSMYSLDANERSGLILDPACGVGSFLAEVTRVLYAEAQSRLAPAETDRWLSDLLRHTVVGIDKSERMLRLATTNLALFATPPTNLHLANSLLRSGHDGRLTDALDGRAALILTNPPFGASFSGSDLDGYQVGQTESARRSKGVDSEILFLERYLDWLMPQGVLLTIVPDSILTNRGVFRDLRDVIARSAEILSVISLPAVTFQAAGTTTKTSILHLRKTRRREQARTYFAICENVGYDVTTRGAQRLKVPLAGGELPRIADEAIGRRPPELGRWVSLDKGSARWDAAYHASTPLNVQRRLDNPRLGDLRVADVAALSSERTDPRTFDEEHFRYIEISDIDASSRTARHKLVRCDGAPSRARKVIRAGDVLVSTVRPERRVVGVVGEDLDGAVCSTGFAVLRPSTIDPHALAKLLQTDFVNVQLLRNNVGIAYPAIYEDCLPDIVLPISTDQLYDISASGAELAAIGAELMAAEHDLSARVRDAIDTWLDA